MKSIRLRLSGVWPLYAGIILTAVLSGSTAHAQATVDLRGYGKVQATLTPERSEFVCESADKADILLGKLLADLFWDAGAEHTVSTVQLGAHDALVHQWPPYGALIAGRNGNRVVVVGGKDQAEAVARASREPALTAAGAVFAPVKPYPPYLDFYDLGAVHCGTLGLCDVNRFRYAERDAFVKQFFPGGFYGCLTYYGRTPAENVVPQRSMQDADLHLAEKQGSMYTISLSTGEWPGWALAKWPGFRDQPSPLHFTGLNLSVPPEALGMSSDQRRQTSLSWLYNVVRDAQASPMLGGYELYCGDYTYETFFMRSYQGHLGYTAVGLAAWRQWLREVRGYSLSALGRRWYGEAEHFSSWNDVALPDPDLFFGNLNSACLRLTDGWSWKKCAPGQVEPSADDAPGWVPVKMPPNQEMAALPPGAAFWRNSFDATAWLRKNAGQQVYLVCNPDLGGWQIATVWLNGTNLGEHSSTVDPLFGPIALPVTRLLRPGANQLVLRVPASGLLVGPIFLTTTPPQAYPYLGKLRNAQWLDMMQWRRDALDFKVRDTMAYTRGLDPDRPLIICATSTEVTDPQGEYLRSYGGSMENTGYESSFHPWNSRLGYAAGFYGSCEQSGLGGVGDPNVDPVLCYTRRLSWMLLAGEGMYKEWYDPACYYDFEKQTGWFTKNHRRYLLFGKYLPEKPQVALLYSSESALLGDQAHEDVWDLGRGEVEASHYDNVYVTESMLAQGLADDYPVLIDTDTLIMSPATIAAIRRYVERGGTFLALQNSGRHSLLEADSWPISELTGFQVLGVGKRGTLTFEKNLPLFKGWEGRQFAGEGSSIDWKDGQYAQHVSVALAPQASDAVALARWEDGSVAVGMRPLGKGRVITLGSTFWRNGRDYGGNGMWRTAGVEPAFLERLFTDLGVQRTADASLPEVYTRKVLTKNGLQDWLIAMNTLGNNLTADLSMAVEAQPAQVWDMAAPGGADAQTPVPFTYADGWVHLKHVTIPPFGTAIYGVQRASLSSGLDLWWLEKTKFWTRRAPLTPAVAPPPVDPADPPTISFENWKFFPDQDGVVSKSDDWTAPAFAAAAWRAADNEPWNLQFDDLKDYGGVGLYRSHPFALPAGWQHRQITINADGALGYCWSSFDLYLNGQKLDNFLRPHRKAEVTGLLRPTGNVICIKLRGRKPGGDFGLSGLIDCAFWLQPEMSLAPTLSLLGPWQSYSADWTTARPVTLAGTDRKLTADGNLKPGLTPVFTNHLGRDVDIPAAWRGKQVYLHAVTPQMNGTRPIITLGLTGGMLMVNGQAIMFDGRPNTPLDQMINVTQYLKFGQPNRFELWPREAAHGSMTEVNLVVNDLTLGCGTEAEK